LQSDGRYLLPFNGSDLGLLLTGVPDAEFSFQVVQLTTVGRQIMELLIYEADIEFYKFLADGIIAEAHAPLFDRGRIVPGRDFSPVKRVALVKLLSPAPNRIESGDEIWASSAPPPAET
jgi:hypothetical protein